MRKAAISRSLKGHAGQLSGADPPSYWKLITLDALAVPHSTYQDSSSPSIILFRKSNATIQLIYSAYQVNTLDSEGRLSRPRVLVYDEPPRLNSYTRLQC